MSGGERITIGDVAEALKAEFPEVSVSKIRFLESEGLINPPRTSSGYREFRSEDVERVRYILRQQRDHFLPLKVIKSNLRSLERGEEPTLAPTPGPPAAAYFGEMTPPTLDAADLARSAGMPASLVDELVDHGIIVPTETPDGPLFGADDVEIAKAAWRMVGHGLESRHLRIIRQGANREVDLLRQMTATLLRHASPASRRQAAEVLAEVAQAARTMQEAMVRAALRETLNG
ncbi:MAG TPA: MerR family transcriptional regulator [Acidimicrobiia bacterium]|nr:MerR family transcriptional regulator [Acidimicrobiia bacterium]